MQGRRAMGNTCKKKWEDVVLLGDRREGAIGLTKEGIIAIMTGLQYAHRGH
jgi:hypothetical protein